MLTNLRAQVAKLEDDLRRRCTAEPEFAAALHQEYAAAREAERISVAEEAWWDERITQAAVAWVLGTLFVRFCEDNGLIAEPWIAGPGERLELAEARQNAFFAENPHLNDRDWLFAAFEYLAGCHSTAAGLFDRGHNPLWQLLPDYEAATALLGFWRHRGEDGELVHVFTNDDLDTRFLGDIYQDLSEHARETYALLQTPEFVEEFILDLTLEPAVEEFGLNPELEIRDASGELLRHHTTLRTIDPACGSGHFLLGLFRRLLEKHRDAAGPTVDDWALVRRALDSVHGCDKNPFAASIARFRLLVAVLSETGVRRLDQASEFPIHVAVGDSLLHGRGTGRPKEQGPDLFSNGREQTFAYSTEDVWEYAAKVDLLGRGSYHVVVGNPPYKNAQDKQERENYRDAYFACHREYSLAVPFAQRIFDLAIRTSGSDRRAGFTGQITANSFMTREFGKVLIETFFNGGTYKDRILRKKRDFSGVALTHVIDTSGAYIPGHGTPTVILAGRNRTAAQRDPIRAVLGIQSEPKQPETPAQGLAWRAIVDQVGNPGSESQWVNVEDVERARFAQYPWSLSGGGSAEALMALDNVSSATLSKVASAIGSVVITGEDPAYILGRPIDAARLGVESYCALVTGETVRDYTIADPPVLIWPYDRSMEIISLVELSAINRLLWRFRETLLLRKRFGVPVEEIRGFQWHAFREFYFARMKTPYFIAFAFVATHNHFVLAGDGKAFNRSAPVIKLLSGATRDDYLRLLGILNSSAACFWLKTVSQGKGGSGLGRGHQDEAWEERYEFTSTKLQSFPLPSMRPLEPARTLDSRAHQLSAQEPSALATDATPTRERLDATRTSHTSLRRRMIALQEELDWQTYGLYNLLNERETAALVSPDFEDVPEVELGERAFEIVLARKRAAGEVDTVWFERHRSTPITEIPAHWPQWYRDIVQARIDTIEVRRDIALIERPECKRRWSSETWEKKERDALRTWLLDACEDSALWFHNRGGIDNVPRTMTVADLADALNDSIAGADATAVAELYAADHLGKPDLRLAEALREITAEEHVPYLAALRCKDSGMRKRAQWEDVWEKQREEDRTGERRDIPVPPKYTSGDFRKPSYWANRGKLDVPKERFVSYPGAGPAADPALVLGWAGWNHLQQAEALKNLVEDRVEQDGWSADQVAPLLAGVLELLPWLRQWHSEYDAEWGGHPANELADWLADQQARHHLSVEDLKGWRPAGGRAR